MTAVKQKILGIIPARYGSSRFPGKMLAKITGKTLIQLTYENARRSPLFDSLVVATDDQRIYNHVQDFGGKAVMTSPLCATGTDRIVDAINNHPHLNDASIVVNVQGDEPCLDLQVIKQIVDALISDPAAAMSTAVVPLDSLEDARNPAVVKCVIDSKHNALYFSRALIPAGHALTMQPNVAYYRHMGVYCFRREFLLHYAELTPTPLQLAEDLEQLKILEHGFRIKVAIANSFSIGVDRPDDIQKVEKWLCKQNISSSQAASAHP